MKKVSMFLVASALSLFVTNAAQAQNWSSNSNQRESRGHNSSSHHNSHHNEPHYKKVCSYKHYEICCEGGAPFIVKQGQKYYSQGEWHCENKIYYKFEYDGCCFYVCYDSHRYNWHASNQCPKGYGGH
jgi:uncharacterized protein (DUF1330 family)